MVAAVQRAFLTHRLWVGAAGLQGGWLKDWATEFCAVIPVGAAAW